MHNIYPICIILDILVISVIWVILGILHFMHILHILLLSREFTQHKGRCSCKALILVCYGLDANYSRGKKPSPGQGFAGDAARNLRVPHECWRHFLRQFIEIKNARVILYGDDKARQTRHSIGAFLGDRQVYIAFFLIKGLKHS